MPTIEITAAQAAALARGENITVESPNTPVSNVVVVPRVPHRGWQHVYHIERGYIDRNSYLHIEAGTHLVGKNGQRAGRHITTGGLSLGQGWKLLVDPR